MIRLRVYQFYQNKTTLKSFLRGAGIQPVFSGKTIEWHGSKRPKAAAEPARRTGVFSEFGVKGVFGGNGRDAGIGYERKAHSACPEARIAVSVEIRAAEEQLAHAARCERSKARRSRCPIASPCASALKIRMNKPPFQKKEPPRSKIRVGSCRYLRLKHRSIFDHLSIKRGCNHIVIHLK